MIIYSAGPFDVVHHEADGMYYVHDVRSGEVVSNYYPLAKTANRRARQLAEARPWTLPTLPVGTPETADNYPGVAPKPQVDDDPRGPEERAYDERQEARVQAQIEQAKEEDRIFCETVLHIDAMRHTVLEALDAIDAEIAAGHRADTREQWLTMAAELLRPIIKERTGLDMTPYRVTCGWPSLGGAGKRTVLGEAWHHRASTSGHAEIFITPAEDDRRMVLAILIHEVLHTCLPEGTGHKRPFCDAAAKMGFASPFTQLVSTPLLWQIADDIIAQLPLYPHAKVVPGLRSLGAPKEQKNRQLKAVCTGCGFTFRASKKWLTVAETLQCPDPDCGSDMVCEGLDEGDDEGEEG